MLTLVTALAAFVRGNGLTRPAGLVFDEFYYGPDACRYIRESADLCGFGELTYFHPPLGKWIMAMGIQTFGPNRLGWRAPAVVFGTLTVIIVFLLARRMFRNTAGAAIASGALALDLLHLVHSRLGMLDVFATFFATASVLCVVADHQGDSDRSIRPWRIAAGICLGAGVASKWAVGLLGIALVALMVAWAWKRQRGGGMRELLSIAVSMILVPAVVYAMSFVGRLDGSLLVWPWADGSWFRAFVERQGEMAAYHWRIKDLLEGGAHPSSSPAWTWPLIKRPMIYFFSVGGNTYQEILALGNPIAWWPALVCMVYAGIQSFRGRRTRYPGTIVACFLAGWLPWVALSEGGPDPYLFYFLPAVPFLCLALGYGATDLWRSLPGRIVTGVFALSLVLSFAFFHPILTARPLTITEWRTRMWFRDCRYSNNTTINARLKEQGLPVVAEELEDLPPGRIAPTRTRPRGWCWI